MLNLKKKLSSVICVMTFCSSQIDAFGSDAEDRGELPTKQQLVASKIAENTEDQAWIENIEPKMRLLIESNGGLGNEALYERFLNITFKFKKSYHIRSGFDLLPLSTAPSLFRGKLEMPEYITGATITTHMPAFCDKNIHKDDIVVCIAPLPYIQKHADQLPHLAEKISKKDFWTFVFLFRRACDDLSRYDVAFVTPEDVLKLSSLHTIWQNYIVHGKKLGNGYTEGRESSLIGIYLA